MRFTLLLSLTACRPADEPAPASTLPTLSEPVMVVPSSGLPVSVQAANNNLDVVRYQDRVYLAFRTAPSHFASTETELYVLSSDDEVRWDLEARFAMGSDLREPRLLAMPDQLSLFFAQLGEDPADFEPQGAFVSRQRGPGDWSEPEPVFEEGFIPWRARAIDGTAYLIGYVGGEEIYDGGEADIQIYWRQSPDGEQWQPVAPDQPVVLTGGGSETDWAFLDDGGVVAVVRNEAGDEDGWGSKICRADADALGDWRCETDPKKYDSPLVFKHGDQVWLIGRRNLTETGDYDLGVADPSWRDKPADQQTLAYELDYWQNAKRCSLWRVDPDALRVEFALDLPSRGDTCFASVWEPDARTTVVYNYSSPLDGPDVDWITGQTGDTHIYAVTLTWPEQSD